MSRPDMERIKEEIRIFHRPCAKNSQAMFDYIQELEKQNAELIKFLVYDYIGKRDSQHPGCKDVKKILEKIKQKPIEEILKEV